MKKPKSADLQQQLAQRTTAYDSTPPPKPVLDALETICAHNDANPGAVVSQTEALAILRERGAQVHNVAAVKKMAIKYLGRKGFLIKGTS